MQTQWLWPQPLANAALVTTSFDASAFLEDDFSACNIIRPEALRRAVAKRKTEYLAGRLCAREALRLATGQSAVPATGADRAPVWPQDSVGSITHGAHWAAALVAPKREYAGLGIDVERRLSTRRAERLMAEILTPAEKARSAAHLQADPAQLITLTFSLKESLFKALYPIVQRRFYFQDAELVSWTEDGQASLQLLTGLSPEWHSGRQLEAQFVVFDDRILSLVAIPAS